MTRFRSVPPPKNVQKRLRKATHQVADYGVFRVERLEYEAMPRDVYVLACSDWCNVIAETTSGDLVFVWQHRFGSDAMSLEIPGGVVDPNETPEAAALRELREETGYEASAIEPLMVVEANPPLQNNRVFSYVARGARLTTTTAFDELEDIEVTLIKRENVPELLDSGQITHALVVVALERYLRRFPK